LAVARDRIRVYDNRKVSMEKHMITKLDIKTHSSVEFQEITDNIREVVAASGVRDGLCHIFVPHTTAGLIVNEHADPAVVEDIAARLDALAPQHKNYRHTEGNAPAHIKASLIGDSRTLFIEDGVLVLGTWQGIFFAEFDGPRSRKVLVKIIADQT
jgi:secondary thiamine-phosphate synthase enzyme